MKPSTLFTTYFLGILIALVGYIINIVKFKITVIDTNFELAQWTAIEVLRVIGILAPPLGVVMGYFV